MLYSTSLSYIDFVPDVHVYFKKNTHNLHLNEHSLLQDLSFYTYLVYHAFLKDKYIYKLLYCSLQYAHT